MYKIPKCCYKLPKYQKKAYLHNNISNKKMSDTVIQIKHSELFDVFVNESIEESFIASDNIKNILSSENIGEEEILNFPFRTNESIIIICVEGYLKAKLDTKSFMLEKNELLVIVPKQIFELKEISPDLSTIVYIMKTSFLDNNTSFFEAIQLQQHFFRENGIQIPESMMNEAITIYRLIKQKLEEKGMFSRQIIQQYINVQFYNVYALLQQQNTQKPAVRTHTKEYIFEQFIRLVERYFREQHKIGFYANRLHLTSKYLSAVIRSASGLTAGQWIREYLIIEARALLKMGKMSIQQISNELNFYDQSHFGVFFKKYAGCSPRAYQKT